MPVIKELLRSESDGSISFGDYSLGSKSKLEDFKHGNDVLKVKTANDTIPLYLFFKFSEEDGLSSIGYYPSPESLLLNQEPLQDKDCLSVCSDLINELGDLCYDYCGDNIGSVIFQSPMVVFRN